MPRPTSQYEPRDPSDSVLANLARDYLPALCEALAVREGDELEAADETGRCCTARPEAGSPPRLLTLTAQPQSTPASRGWSFG